MKASLTEVIKKTNEDPINNMGKSIVGFLINWGVNFGVGMAAQILMMLGLIFFIFQNIWCYIIGSVIIAILGIISLSLAGVIEYGLYVFYLKITRGEETTYSTLFSGKNYIKKITLFQILKYVKFGIYLILGCAVVFVPHWLISPERDINIFETIYIIFFSIFLIIKLQIYNFGYYIINDNPEIGIFEVFRRIRSLIRGEIVNVLLVFLVYLLVMIISLCTLWIGIIIGVPYIMILFANYYNSLEDKQEKEYL